MAGMVHSWPIFLVLWPFLYEKIPFTYLSVFLVFVVGWVGMTIAYCRGMSDEREDNEHRRRERIARATCGRSLGLAATEEERRWTC